MRERLEAELRALHDEFLTGLADLRQLRILSALGARPKSARELSLELEADPAVVSRQLWLMRERGLVLASTFRGETCYEASDIRLLEAMDLLRGVLRDRTYRRAEMAALAIR